MLFAIDQQQYLQGYLPVVFAVLFVTNLNTVGNGAPVLTGPGIINKANAAKVAALAAEGHALDEPRAGGAAPAARPGGPADPMAETAAPSPGARRAARPTSASLDPAADAAGHRRVPRRGRRLLRLRVLRPRRQLARRPRRSPPAGPTRRRSTGSSPSGRAADDRRRVRPLRRRDDRQLRPAARLPDDARRT